MRRPKLETISDKAWDSYCLYPREAGRLHARLYASFARLATACEGPIFPAAEPAVTLLAAVQSVGAGLVRGVIFDARQGALVVLPPLTVDASEDTLFLCIRDPGTTRLRPLPRSATLCAALDGAPARLSAKRLANIRRALRLRERDRLVRVVSVPV